MPLFSGRLSGQSVVRHQQMAVWRDQAIHPTGAQRSGRARLLFCLPGTPTLCNGLLLEEDQQVHATVRPIVKSLEYVYPYLTWWSCVLCVFPSRGSVCNVLLTCCKDSVCRLWAETLLPSDSLLSGHTLSHVNNNGQSSDSLKSSGSKKTPSRIKTQDRNPLEVGRMFPPCSPSGWWEV